MFPLGSTILQSAIDTVTCYGCFVFTPMSHPSDRQNWRVSIVVRVCNGNGANTSNPAVINGYTLPLSSTNTDGHSDGDVECPFCFYPTFLPITDRFNNGAWTILVVDFLIVFDQNRYSSTQTFYTTVLNGGDHG